MLWSRKKQLTHLVCPFAPWRRRSSITELRLCAFVAPCQKTKLLNQLTKLFLSGSFVELKL